MKTLPFTTACPALSAPTASKLLSSVMAQFVTVPSPVTLPSVTDSVVTLRPLVPAPIAPPGKMPPTPASLFPLA